jgi:hypothetical protein
MREMGSRLGVAGMSVKALGAQLFFCCAEADHGQSNYAGTMSIPICV